MNITAEHVEAAFERWYVLRDLSGEEAIHDQAERIRVFVTEFVQVDDEAMQTFSRFAYTGLDGSTDEDRRKSLALRSFVLGALAARSAAEEGVS